MNKAKIKEIKAIYARKNTSNRHETITIDSSLPKNIEKHDTSFFNSIIDKLNIYIDK